MLRKIRKMLQQQEGFTLVELMIVVVILGILAGVGIQQYGNVQERARAAAHEANIKVLTSAANMYLMMENPTDPSITIPGTGETESNNVLVTDYLDAWPKNPYTSGDKEGDYKVDIERTLVTGTTNDYRYSISVRVE